MAASFEGIDFSKRIILITCHRRELFGSKIRGICSALNTLAQKFSDCEFVYPVHLNPNVQGPVHELLNQRPNIHLLNPLPYDQLIWLLRKSTIVLTDSGGIQEEAPALGKPVLVLRDETERLEGIEAGTAKLVGTTPDDIIREASLLLENQSHYAAMANAVNPYGDGQSSHYILRKIAEEVL